MTKGELLKLLEPFTDEIQILTKIPMGTCTFKPVSYAKYVQCEKIGCFFQETKNPSKSEGCIWLS